MRTAALKSWAILRLNSWSFLFSEYHSKSNKAWSCDLVFTNYTHKQWKSLTLFLCNVRPPDLVIFVFLYIVSSGPSLKLLHTMNPSRMIVFRYLIFIDIINTAYICNDWTLTHETKPCLTCYGCCTTSETKRNFTIRKSIVIWLNFSVLQFA